MTDKRLLGVVVKQLGLDVKEQLEAVIGATDLPPKAVAPIARSGVDPMVINRKITERLVGNVQVVEHHLKRAALLRRTHGEPGVLEVFKHLGAKRICEPVHRLVLVDGGHHRIEVHKQSDGVFGGPLCAIVERGPNNDALVGPKPVQVRKQNGVEEPERGEFRGQSGKGRVGKERVQPGGPLTVDGCGDPDRVGSNLGGARAKERQRLWRTLLIEAQLLLPELGGSPVARRPLLFSLGIQELTV